MSNTLESGNDGEHVSGNFQKLEWTNRQDRKLLQAVDEYVAVFGKLLKEDWQIITTFAFEDPRQLVDVYLRYKTLSETLLIRTYEDYNSYQRSTNKSSWLHERRLDSSNSCLQQGVQRGSLKASFKEDDAALEKDLLIIQSMVCYDTLLNREILRYLRPYNRIGLLRYLDVVDKLIDRMPDKDNGRWARNETNVIMDFETIISEIGESFDRNQGRVIIPLTLNPPAGLHVYCDKTTAEELLENPYCMKILDTKCVRKMMEDKVNGMFTPNEWAKIFTVEDDWSALLTRLRHGRYHPGWFTEEYHFRENQKLFQEKMRSVGMETSKSRQEVELEYFAYVIPNFWIFPDFLVTKDSNFEYLICKECFSEVSNKVCVTIYHSLTFVSLKHVRKTILYLFVCGVMKEQGYCTPTAYYNGFISLILDLPCGECWMGEPVQFEKVRSILKKELEMKGLSPPIPPASYQRWSECIKGTSCWWKNVSVRSE